MIGAATQTPCSPTAFVQELPTTKDSGRVLLGAGMLNFSVADPKAASHVRPTASPFRNISEP